jgi:hypothetical protein
MKTECAENIAKTKPGGVPRDSPSAAEPRMDRMPPRDTAF